MTIEEKLQHFYESSVEEAKEEAAKEIKEHKITLSQMLGEHKTTCRQNAEAMLKAETENARREVNKALAAEQITLKRDMSKKQNELKDKLFAEVKKHLEDFKASPEYMDYLCEKIQDARDFAGEDEIHIYLSSDDSELLDTMIHRSMFPLEVSETSFLGGIKATIPSKNILIDNSFQENFDVIRKEFKFNGGAAL